MYFISKECYNYLRESVHATGTSTSGRVGMASAVMENAS